MTLNTLPTFIFAALTSLLVVSSVHARPPGKGQPPEEAIAACQDKSEGDSVTFTTPRGEELTATCTRIEAHLVAIPTDRPQRPQKQ